MVVTYCILILLLGIVAFAHPTLRSKRHNSFEKAHRFLGWTATALVWCQVRSTCNIMSSYNLTILKFVLLANDYKLETQSLGMTLVKSAPFWLLVVLTGTSPKSMYLKQTLISSFCSFNNTTLDQTQESSRPKSGLVKSRRSSPLRLR